jgi:hypothetical protein
MSVRQRLAAQKWGSSVPKTSLKLCFLCGWNRGGEQRRE